MVEEELLQVLVYSERGRSVGLIVDSIEDVVDQDLSVRREVNRLGVAAEAVIQDKVTELLDIRALVRSRLPDFFRSEAAE
jgi:two-component system chemotaxis sensor kinase CheA